MDSNGIIAEDFVRKHPLRAAQVLERLKGDEIAKCIVEIPMYFVVPMLNLMNLHKVVESFPFLGQEFIKNLIGDVRFTLTEPLLRQLDESSRTTVLDMLSPSVSTVLRKKLEQAPNSVGALMAPTIMPIYKEMDIKEAQELVKKNRHMPITYLFVIDMEGKFEGVVKLHELFLSDGSLGISSVMDNKIQRFSPDMPVSSIIDHPVWYEYRIIPIVDTSQKLIGTLPFEKVHLNPSSKNGDNIRNVLETGNALGELYRIGLTGFLQSFE